MHTKKEEQCVFFVYQIPLWYFKGEVMPCPLWTLDTGGDEGMKSHAWRFACGLAYWKANWKTGCDEDRMWIGSKMVKMMADSMGRLKRIIMVSEHEDGQSSWLILC